MKTSMLELKKQAKELLLISKEKKLIRPHTEAFKDFPVKEENHKGKNKKDN